MARKNQAEMDAADDGDARTGPARGEGTGENVGTFELEDGTTAIKTVCSDNPGHAGGKGHVASGQLGIATCGDCGKKLTARDNTAETRKKGSGGGTVAVDAKEPPAAPGPPKVAVNDTTKAAKGGTKAGKAASGGKAKKATSARKR